MWLSDLRQKKKTITVSLPKELPAWARSGPAAGGRSRRGRGGQASGTARPCPSRPAATRRPLRARFPGHGTKARGPRHRARPPRPPPLPPDPPSVGSGAGPEERPGLRALQHRGSPAPLGPCEGRQTRGPDHYRPESGAQRRAASRGAPSLRRGPGGYLRAPLALPLLQLLRGVVAAVSHLAV